MGADGVPGSLGEAGRRWTWALTRPNGVTAGADGDRSLHQEGMAQAARGEALWPGPRWEGKRGVGGGGGAGGEGSAKEAGTPAATPFNASREGEWRGVGESGGNSRIHPWKFLEELHALVVKGVDREVGQAMASLKSVIEDIKSKNPFMAKRGSRELEPTSSSPANTAEARSAFYTSLVSEQMKPWIQNPSWDHDTHPTIQVSNPEGYFCQLESQFIVGLPPGQILNLFSNPHSAAKVFSTFREIKSNKLIKDDGEIIHTNNIHTILLKFPWKTYKFDLNFDIIQDRKANRMEFKLRKPGFMKKFYALWEIYPFLETQKNKLDLKNPSSLVSLPPSPVISPKHHTKAGLHPPTQPRPFLGFNLRNRRVRPSPSSHHAAFMAESRPQERIASIVVFKQRHESRLAPPFFLKGYVIKHSAEVAKQILLNLQKEAKRVRHISGEGSEAN